MRRLMIIMMTPLPLNGSVAQGETEKVSRLGRTETLDYSLLSPPCVLRPASRVRPVKREGVPGLSLVSVSQVRKPALMVPGGNNERISPTL